MSKLWNFLAFLVILVNLVTGQIKIPTVDETLDALVASGVSQNTAAGIVKFDRKLQEAFDLEKTNPEEAKELEEVVREEFNEYIDSLSEDDQTAYQNYIKKQNSKH
uniref:DUF148 domain-containing protein n=1 Tax=Caenorhabditis tropicalis TaxID=1561998 RepID=A0A1I7TSW2_9PELO